MKTGMRTGKVRRVTSNGAVAALVVGILALVGAAASGAAQLVAQQDSPEELAERLQTIEERLPALPPDEVILREDETWAELPGNYRGAQIALDDLADETHQLFIDASDADGEVAAAVSDIARALLVARQGYVHLADWEDADLEFPLDAEDDRGVATGADDLVGKAETGLHMLLDAAARRLPAYEVLARAGSVPDEAQRYFEVQLEAMRDFDLNRRPRLHRALSLPTTQAVRPTDRFETAAPGGEARARSLRFVCVERETYLEQGLDATADLPETLAELDEDTLAALGADAPASDCVELDNRNEVRLLRR